MSQTKFKIQWVILESAVSCDTKLKDVNAGKNVTLLGERYAYFRFSKCHWIRNE